MYRGIRSICLFGGSIWNIGVRGAGVRNPPDPPGWSPGRFGPPRPRGGPARPGPRTRYPWDRPPAGSARPVCKARDVDSAVADEYCAGYGMAPTFILK